MYNHGIDQEGSILEAGIQCGAVDKKGAWIQFQGELIGQGKEAARRALQEKPELMQKMVHAIQVKRGFILEEPVEETKTPAKSGSKTDDEAPKAS
jgi:recombination protein RecA